MGNKLQIQGITMRVDNTFRIMVDANEEMRKAVINKINNEYDGDMESYLPNDINDLCVEIEITNFANLCIDYNVVYFFDDYECLDVVLTDEQIDDLISFIVKWKYKIPNNDDLLLGDDEWLEMLPDDIEWKKNVI